MPELLKCESATCRSGKPAVLEVEGDVEGSNGTKQHVVLRICVECAGPLLKVGHPISMEAKCSP